MAVIREQRRFQIGNIGVVRASSAGEQAAVSAMQSADKLINMAFDGASKEAKKKGVQLAKSLDESNIRTINPATGMPEALSSTPSGFGQIARDAYEATISDRYRISIDREIKQKASEFALEADQTEDPVGSYEQLMGSYLDSMKENAQGEYFNYINEFGAAYLASTKLNLQEAAIQRDRANGAVEITENIRDEYPLLVSMITSGADDAVIEEATNKLTQLIDRAESSRSLDAKSAEQLRNVVGRAKTEGSIQMLLATDIPIEDTIKIRSALSTNGNTLKLVDKKYRADVKKILDTWNFSNDAGTVDAIIQSNLQTKTSIRQEETRTLREDSAAAYPQLIQDLRNRSRRPAYGNSSYDLNTEDISVAMDQLKRDMANNQFLAGKAVSEINAGDPAALMQIGRREIIQGFVGRLATDNPTRQELIAIEQFFTNRGRDSTGVPEKYLPTMQTMIKEGVYTTDDEQFLSSRISRLEADESYRVAEEKRIESEKEARVADVLEFRWGQQKSSEIGILSEKAGSVTTDEELAELIADRTAYVNGIEADLADPKKDWLTEPEATKAVTDLDRQITESWANSLIEAGRTFTMIVGDDEVETPLTSDIVLAVANAFEKSDANVNGLPKELRPQIQSLIDNVGKNSLNNSAAGVRTLAGQLATQEREAQETIKLQNAAADVALSIDGNTADHKAVVNAAVYAENEVPETFFRLGESIQPIQTADGMSLHPATQALYNMGNKNQRLPSTFLGDLETIANGKMLGNAAVTSVMLQHYKELKTMKDPASNRTNNVFASLKGDRLSPQAMAALDTILGVLEVRGIINQDGTFNNESVAEVVVNVGQSLRDPSVVKANNVSFMSHINAEKTAGSKDSIESWLLKSVGGSRVATRDLLPYAKHLIDLGDLDPEGIKERITQLYKDYYPETEGYVVDVSINDIRRSPNALSRRIPDPVKRQGFLEEIESKLPDGMTILKRNLPDTVGRGDDSLFAVDNVMPIGTVGMIAMSAESAYQWLRGPYDVDQDRLFRETMSGEQKAYLVPQRYSGDASVRYYVHTLDTNNTLVPVIKDGKVMAFQYPAGQVD